MEVSCDSRTVASSDNPRREEQHDDQMLYEILRCVKALSTSEVSYLFFRII